MNLLKYLLLEQCSVITLVLSFVSFVLSALASDGCQFIKLQVKNTVQLRYVGMFSSFVEEKGCKVLVFSNGKVPRAVRAAQAFGVMTPLVGGIALLICLSQIVTKVSVNIFRCLGIVYIICFAFQLFTFTLFAIDDCTKSDRLSCDLGPDAFVAIMASFFYIVSSVIMFLMTSTERSLISTMLLAINEGADNVRGGTNNGTVISPPPPQIYNPDDDMTDIVKSTLALDTNVSKGSTSVRQTETFDADGKKTTTRVVEQLQEDRTKKVITETTHPDGTVTITTKTENAV